MKTPGYRQNFTISLKTGWWLALAFMTVAGLPAAPPRQAAGETSPATASPATAVAVTADPGTTAPAAQPESAPAPARRAASPLSPGVEDVLKMTTAGVSSEVIKTYVECSRANYELNAADLIALKERKVSDDIVTAMLRRSSRVQAQAQAQPAGAEATVSQGPAAPAPAVAVPVNTASAAAYIQPDPDSYAYFQTYYLHPRTLASVYQRLYPYSLPYGGYYGGFYPTYGFSPAFSFGYGYPARAGFRAGVTVAPFGVMR